MVDLETLSVRQNAVILSIGAVRFIPPELGTLGSVLEDTSFYVNIQAESCVQHGLHIDPDTVEWWKKQSDEARRALSINPQPLREALLTFSAWFGPESKPTWANPSTFDLTVLENAYRAVALEPPWKFYDARCFRTVRALRPDIEMVRHGVAHHALDDAFVQARHLIKVLKAMQEDQLGQSFIDRLITRWNSNGENQGRIDPPG